MPAIRIGINPISWSNDDLPALGGETPLSTALSEGKEIGIVRPTANPRQVVLWLACWKPSARNSAVAFKPNNTTPRQYGSRSWINSSSFFQSSADCASIFYLTPLIRKQVESSNRRSHTKQISPGLS